MGRILGPSGLLVELPLGVGRGHHRSKALQLGATHAKKTGRGFSNPAWSGQVVGGSFKSRGMLGMAHDVTDLSRQNAMLKSVTFSP